LLRLSIRNQLILLLASVAVPLVVLSVFTIVTDFRHAIKMAEQEGVFLAEGRARSIEQFIIQVEELLGTVAADPGIGSGDRNRCQTAIDPITAAVPSFTPVLVVGPEGRWICASLDLSSNPAPVGDRLWFTRAWNQRGFSIGRPIRGRLTNRPVVVMGLPVLDADGEPRAVVGFPVTQDRIQGLLTLESEATQDILVTLADTLGFVLGRSRDPELWVGRDLPQDPESKPDYRQHQGLRRTTAADGREHLFAFHKVAGTSWVVWVGIPMEVVWAGAGAKLRTQLVFTLMILLVTSGVALFLNRRINRSLSTLTSEIGRSGDGAHEAVSEDGPEEIARVARQFNRTLQARMDAEAEAEANAARYHSVMDNAAFGIYVGTPEGRILEANPAMARLLGVPDAAAVKNMSEPDFYVDPTIWESQVGQALLAPTTHPQEAVWRHSSGTQIHVRLFRCPVIHEDGTEAIEVFAEDLTERRSLEEQFRQIQKMEAMGRLAGGVAHEFNNRLMVIRGQTEILQIRLGDRPDLDRHLRSIIESVDRAAGLTGQLLASGRKQVTQPTVVQIGEVIEKITPMLGSLLGERIRVETSVDATAQPVMVDPHHLEQIVMNLVVNARDAMPDGGRITIATSRVEISPERGRGRVDFRPGRFTVLRIRDTGVGMDDGVKAHVFEPFFTTKARTDGTGLGLSTVYGLVQQNGGFIELESRVGEGSEFSIYLPEVDVEPAAAAPGPTAPAASQPPCTVLLAEDEDEVRDILAQSLRQNGFTVIEAGDGKEAVALAHTVDMAIDLLITDMVMPGMGGSEVAEAVKKTFPDVGVVIMSGYTADSPFPEHRDDQKWVFLSKPFSIGSLLRAVAEVRGAMV